MVLGQISLNLSCVIYLFLYVPQVIHNHKQISLEGLSVHLHIILYAAYGLDVLYGVGTHLPWQYVLVSSIGWVLLTLQHAQFIRHFKRSKRILWQGSFYIGLLCISTVLAYAIAHPGWLHRFQYLCGYLAQIGFSVALAPQILKSYRLQSTQAIHVLFIGLNFILNLLDSITAWQLNWGWPNKLGALCGLLLSSILLLQYSRCVINEPEPVPECEPAREPNIGRARARR